MQNEAQKKKKKNNLSTNTKRGRRNKIVKIAVNANKMHGKINKAKSKWK